MKGKVIVYDATTFTGKISGHDGKRYNFNRQDWQDAKQPKVGIEVDFETDENNNAKDVIVIKGSGTSEKSRTTYVVLGLFLGAWGAHNFYAKRTGIAIAQLLIGLTLFGLLITVPWALIDIIVIKKDGEGNDFC